MKDTFEIYELLDAEIENSELELLRTESKIEALKNVRNWFEDCFNFEE